MATNSTWLFEIAHSAGLVVLFGVYLAGVVICLRRWHAGQGIRWVAAGFASFIVNSLLSFGLRLLLIVFPLNSGSVSFSVEGFFLLYSIMSQLISIAGGLCLVLGIRSLAVSLAKKDNAFLLPIDSVEHQGAQVD